MRERTDYPHYAREEIVDVVPDGVRLVLDVGCNTGGFAEALKRRQPDVEIWGVEPDPEAARRAAPFVDRVFTGLFDATLDLPAQAFDAIVFNDVLEHMPEPWDVLERARALLKAGGVIVGSLPNFLHNENLLHVLRDRDFRYEDDGIRDRTHLRFFTQKSAARMFDGCGYDVIRLDGINAIWWTRSRRRRLVYKLFSRFLHDTKFLQMRFVLRPRPGRSPVTVP